jgi:hypothetical protein
MRAFADIERELGLKRFLWSELGTLYFVPQAANGPKIMVRRFDGEAPPGLVGPYAELVKAAQEWLDERAHLGRLVRVEQPVEVGTDFIARKFHVYTVRTNSYLDPENPPEPPEELEQIREIFREEAGQSDDPRDVIVERVLARSILEPSGKTYPGEPEDGSAGTQFVIVDPKLSRQDLEEWAAVPRGWKR